MRVPIFLALLLAGASPQAVAHVGNPDVYFEGQAGPYRLHITLRPPAVVPGVAEIEVRTSDSRLRSLRAVPVPLEPQGAKFAPVPDQLRVSDQDPQFFTGSLWIMAAGSWQVRFSADGQAGRASLAVPLPSVARTVKKMQLGLGSILFVLMFLLAAGLVLISGASVRQAKLAPSAEPTPDIERRSPRAMASCTLVVVGVLAFGWWWWNSEETQYRRNIFNPLRMQADLRPSGLLKLSLNDPSDVGLNKAAQLRPAFFTRTVDDLVPDHDHLMHLYAIRQPGLDFVYHLHPQMTGAGEFRLQLPEMQPGSYRLYADIVHVNGFPETLVADLAIPSGLPKRPLQGDDAEGSAAPIQQAPLNNTSVRLPDGYTMQWERSPESIRARRFEDFRFVLLDARGQPPRDMSLYMGMLGHAAFINANGSAFAHIHPSGSVSMASLMMADEQLGRKHESSRASSTGMNVSAMDMSGMDMSAMDARAHSAIPNEVSFPYGFPFSGRYRIVVQMKHGQTVETAMFDTSVQ